MLIGAQITSLRSYLSESGHKMTMEKFGKRIGVSKHVVVNLEYNRVEPTDLIVKSICREFGVNEVWLRTGEGNMFTERSERERIAEMFSTILSERNKDGFREVRIALAELVADLPEDALKLVVDFAKKLAEKYA